MCTIADAKVRQNYNCYNVYFYECLRVTHEQAVEKALSEYDKFRIIQDREIMSDFDKQLKLLLDNKKQDGKE